MITKTQALHCIVIQPINNFFYDKDNEYIHNTAVGSQQLPASLKMSINNTNNNLIIPKITIKLIIS